MAIKTVFFDVSALPSSSTTVQSQLIDEKTDLGLDLDTTICHEFEKKMKDKNFIFSVGIDWIYEIFNIESKTKNEVLSKSINFLGKNKFLNSFFKKYADEGFIRE